ncbi:MAG: YeeE/YedE family protein [Deltaproteobacteria bacterium]|nr:YeeE/YedE family protein [Deltaproteobacteria bacterium]
MNALIPLVCGAIFSAGVCIAGMVRPSKVLGFLDFGGRWDATLLVVFATALALHVIAWRIVKGARAPRFGAQFPGPPSKVIDARLVGGAVLFGIGWGLAGYCPGPAIVAVVSGAKSTLVFVAAMLVGIALAHALKSDDRTE